MFTLIIIFIASAVLCVGLTLPWLWILKTFKIGQSIRAEGPEHHLKKTGTPTAGGASILLAILILALILIDFSPPLWALLIPLLGYGLTGLLDDLIKIFRRPASYEPYGRPGQNLGLNVYQKLLPQLLIALCFGFSLLTMNHSEGVAGILKTLGFGSPWLYLPLVVFMMVGTANASNLTDGMDGLLAGTAGLAFLTYGFLAYNLKLGEVAAFSMLTAGACFSFLIFNFYPAKLFMGDVGSLSLGAILAAVAILTHKELLLILIGGVFVIEALSVIAQVVFYKRTGRRIFRMAPLHHHFELLGFSEPKIVLGFWVVAALLSILGIVLA